MKKLFGIVVLSLLFSGNAYAKKGWAFTYKNYYDTSVSGAAFHKNITKAMNMALSKCQEKSKKKNLKPYQVNKELMKKAKSDVIFMHCLPVGRGEEVTDEVIDSKQSVVWTQALNRVHAQKSIINWCFG